MENLQGLANAVAGAEPITSTKLEVVPGRAIHVDADMLCYVAGGNEDTSVATSRRIVQNMVETFREQAQAERSVLQLTASGCLKGYRVLVPTSQPYQAQRKGSKRPKNWGYLRDWLSSYDGPDFKVKVWEDREADDGFGYVSASRPNDVVCTNDKDMRMLPGWHLDWVTKELFKVPEDCYEMEQGGKLWVQVVPATDATRRHRRPHPWAGQVRCGPSWLR